MGETYDIFTGDQIEMSPIHTRFSEALVPDLVHGLDDLGIAPEFTAIFAKHVSDLHIVINPVGDKRPSRLTVMKHDDEYKRFAVLSHQDLQRHSARLAEASQCLGLTLDKDNRQKVALTWIFFELSADALSNSVYMQHRYDKYIPDFDGQRYSWESENTLARNFLSEYAADTYTIDEVMVERERFRAGFALFFLKDALLRYGVVDRDKQAEWLIQSLRHEYPYWDYSNKMCHKVVPEHTRELMQRVQSIEVKKPLLDLAEYVLAMYGPEDDIAD
jgi:hypothetical protein